MNVQTAIYAGLFVQFVYNAYETLGHTASLDGLPVTTAAGAPVIPGKSYNVLKTIYANDLATAITPLSPDKFVTIGIVAQSTSDPADIWIAIRGTEGIWEWLQDFKFLARPFDNVSGAGLTEDGFTDMYDSFSFTLGSNTGDDFLTKLLALIPSNSMLTVTGHSLGAALSTLLSLDLAGNSNLPVASYTLASPRVGDLTFEHLFDHIVPDAYRIANRCDIVPKTPPPLLYFHVGDETELLPPNTLAQTLPCEHHLTSYLYMLAALINQSAQYPIDAECIA